MLILLWSGGRIGELYLQHAQIGVWLEVKQDESVMCYTMV